MRWTHHRSRLRLQKGVEVLLHLGEQAQSQGEAPLWKQHRHRPLDRLPAVICHWAVLLLPAAAVVRLQAQALHLQGRNRHRQDQDHLRIRVPFQR